MAIVTSMWLKGSKKRLGGTVIYQAMGQTRQRELAVEVSNPRTDAQMTQRVKWSNLVNFYRANRSWMKYAFETKKPNQTEYNKLMSLNVATSPIYLPKQIAAQGGCVVAPYLITQGSLPSIEWLPTGIGVYQSNIILDETFDTTDPTVADFSRTLLDNNPAIRQGDQLSLIRNTQMSNSDTGAPYIICREYEVIVDPTNQRRLYDYIPEELIGSDEAAGGAHLFFNPNGNSGGFAMILSRTISGRTYVSSQRLVIVGNEALISLYSGDQALMTAIASYGSSQDAFLSSVSASTNVQAVVPLSVLSASYEEGRPVGASGNWIIDELVTGNTFIAYFSGLIPADPSSWRVITSAGTYNVNMAGRFGARLEGEVQGASTTPTNVRINAMEIIISNVTYRIDFFTPTPPGSLE